MAEFRNFYRCYRCKHEWQDQWSATVDDDCPACGARHCSPYESEDVDQDDKEGTDNMATKAFHIELRVTNIDTPERMKSVRRALQEAGRVLNAKALLICGNDPAPEILLYGEDFVEGRTDIEVKNEEDGQ